MSKLPNDTDDDTPITPDHPLYLSEQEIEQLIKRAMREKGYTTYIDRDGVEKPL